MSLVAEFQFQSLKGEALPALPEWESAWIVLPQGCQRLSELELCLAGESLPLQWNPRQQQVQALWQQRGPGRYLLQLFAQQRLCWEQVLEVWPARWGRQGLLALQSQPVSQRLFQLSQQMQSHFVFSDPQQGPERALDNLPALYQIWTICHVLLTLSQVAPRLGFQLQGGDCFKAWPGALWFRVFPRGQRLME